MRSFEKDYLLQSQNIRFDLVLLIPNSKMLLTILKEIYFIAPLSMVVGFSWPPLWYQKYFIAPLIGLKKFRGPLGDLNGPVLWTLIVDPWKFILLKFFFPNNFCPKLFAQIYFWQIFFPKIFFPNFFCKICFP